MPEAEPKEVTTTNDFMIAAGQNMGNHSSSLAGLGKFVRQSMPTVPLFRTKQAAFRYAAWLSTMAEAWLPDEDGQEEHTFEVVRDAIRNA